MKKRALTTRISRSSAILIKDNNNDQWNTNINEKDQNNNTNKLDILNSKSQINTTIIKDRPHIDLSTYYSTPATSTITKSTITLLTPKSHDIMRTTLFKNNTTKNSNSSEKTKKNNSIQNLKLSSLIAEPVEVNCDSKDEDYFQNYEEYRKNFHRLVFDKKKNLLYTKPSIIKGLFDNRSHTSSIDSHNTDRLYQKLDTKYKDIQSNNISVINLESSTNLEKSNKKSPTLRIDQIKKKSLSLLKINLRESNNEKVVQEAKLQIDQVALETKEILEKTGLENLSLKEELKNLKIKLEDIISENGILSRKNQLLIKELEELRVKNESISKSMLTLERFIPMYSKLREKFPNEDIKSIIGKYDKLENYCVTHIKHINELEDDNRILKYEKEMIKKEVQAKKEEMQYVELERNKHLFNIRGEIDKKDITIEKQKEIVADYNLLVRKIFDLYIRWTEKMNIFITGEVKADIKDPMEMIDIMGRMVDISTPKLLQEKIRKIIVSANMLMRRYFPENINEKFDADKIYEKINKYIGNMETEIKRLKSVYDGEKTFHNKKIS